MIAARVDKEDVDEAARVLEIFDPVDLDSSSREWLKASGAEQAGAGAGAPLGTGITGGSQAGTTNTGALPGMGLLTEGADDLGTADLRTGDAGSATTTGTGSRRSEERADQEGANELAVRSQPSPDQPGLMQRHMNRGGRVWAYRSPDEGSL